MTVSDMLDNLKEETQYVVNSMILKSYDDNGCTYKYLSEYKTDHAVRKEVFMATTGTGDLEGRTVTEWVYVYPAV